LADPSLFEKSLPVFSAPSFSGSRSPPIFIAISRDKAGYARVEKPEQVGTGNAANCAHQLEAFFQAGASFLLVFERRRDPERLAEILLVEYSWRSAKSRWPRR